MGTRVLIAVAIATGATCCLSGCGIKKFDSRSVATQELTPKPGGDDAVPTTAPQVYPTNAPASYLACTGLAPEDVPDEAVAGEDAQELCNTLNTLSFSANPANEQDDPLDF